MYYLTDDQGKSRNEILDNLRSLSSYFDKHMELNELFPWLQKRNVISDWEADNIDMFSSTSSKNFCLLEYLYSKSEDQINLFVQGLVECDQAHLAELIDPSSKYFKHFLLERLLSEL